MHEARTPLLKPSEAARTEARALLAEVGVGVVHHAEAWVDRPLPSDAVVALTRRVKSMFDPTGRLNPGVDVLEGAGVR